MDLTSPVLPSPATPLEAVVRMRGRVPAEQRLRLQVLDAADRLVAEETLAPVAAENRVQIDVADSRTVGNRLRVWLERFRSAPSDVSETPFTVNQPFDARDLHLLVWGSGGGTYTADLLRRELRAWGAGLADVSTGPWTPQPLDEAGRAQVLETLADVVSSGLRPVPYICRIWSDTATGDGSVRDPCLTSPTYRAQLASAVEERAALCRLFCPAGYTLGDENYLGQATSSAALKRALTACALNSSTAMERSRN